MEFQNINSNTYSVEKAVLNIVFYAENFRSELKSTLENGPYIVRECESIKSLSEETHAFSINDLNNHLLIEVTPENTNDVFNVIETLKNHWLTRNIIIILLLTEENIHITKRALKLGVSDCYNPPIPFNDVIERLRFLSFYKHLRSEKKDIYPVETEEYKIPVGKRFLDIFLSSIALICLSPLFILIAILIKLDSKGPVFYTSKRVGTGYKIFDFYKFRSMRKDADKEVAKLAKNNQYEGDSAFFKLKDDPRVTKLGNFLRNSSIDELPQLFNVVKGDMSLVGNRPLPLYEAEKLTTNEWSMRFLAPAGLTGLWQISRRGKKDMSERERKKLDNFYASNYSIWLDLKIIMKTIPALIQKEKV